MSRRLIKVILILVSMLFINIEAAHAGLLGKLKLYIGAEITDWQLALACCGTVSLLFFLYIVFTPLYINNQRWSWYSYFTFQPETGGFKNRKRAVSKINHILTQKRAE